MEVDEEKSTSSDTRPKRGKQKRMDNKPWDTEDVDKWKIEPFKEGDMKTPLLEESSFATLFPTYREKYLRESWPEVTRRLEQYGIGCELNLVEGSMRVFTTRRTWDPFAILKARDLIRLLSRSVPMAQAMKIMTDDEMACDIIKIRGFVRNKDKFAKRRQRLIGPNGATLKAIELLTQCYLMVQGNTVAAMGSYKGLKAVRRVVEDCMQNVHPIYHIKELMIKRELAKDPELKNENWDRFLPQFKKKNVPRKKVKAADKATKKERSAFPPEQTPRKIDLQMESGEYFLKPDEKRAKLEQEKREKQREALERKSEERKKAFVPPVEKHKLKKSSVDAQTAAADAARAGALSKAQEISVHDLGQRFKEKEAVTRKTKRPRDDDATEYVADAPELKRRNSKK